MSANNYNVAYKERTLVSLYVGMARKQDGGSNGIISNYTTITRPRASTKHFEALVYLTFLSAALANKIAKITRQQR